MATNFNDDFIFLHKFITAHISQKWVKVCLLEAFFGLFLYSGRFDLSDVMCEHHHRNAFNPYLNDQNNGLKNAMFKRTFTIFWKNYI